MKDVTALVARLYEDHPYPKPVTDIAEAVTRGGYQAGDPSLWGPMLWPEGRPGEHLKILVAGCGTSQAAWFAYTNRGSDVFGVDLSEASLAHQRYLQDKHGLHNLRLLQGDLRDAGDLGFAFDLIVCTGVLHHMADPDAGVRALAAAMAPHAAMAAMVYAAPHRTGVYMLQDVFRRLDVSADAQGVAFVRRTLSSLPPWHFAQRYVGAANELEHDVALIDTFLHPQDRAYTVPQLLALVEDNGLHFQGWMENSIYYPQGCRWFPPELAERVATLPEREQWATMEMLNIANYAHFFFARKSRPPQISFAAGNWPVLAPSLNPGVRRVAKTEFARLNLRFGLSEEETAIVERADGRRTIGELAQAHELELARALFEKLWKQGHVMLAKPQASSSTSQ